MYSTKYSIVGLLVVLAMVFSMFSVIAPSAPVYAADATAVTLIHPRTDNVTWVSAAPSNTIPSANQLPVRYDLRGPGGDNGVQVIAYTSPTTSTISPNRVSNDNYTDSVSILLNSTENAYNVVVSANGLDTGTAGTGALKVDNTRPTGSVLTPASTTVWKGGSTQTVYWDATDRFLGAQTSETVSISLAYTTDGTTWTELFTRQPKTQNQGSYSWVGLPGVNSNACQMRMQVVDRAGNISENATSGIFTILNAAPTIGITFPSASTTWTSGQSCNITWTTAGAPLFAQTLNYVLKYDVGLSTYPYTIATFSRTRLATDSYAFTAPYVPSASRSTVRVKVEATDAAGNPSSAFSGGPLIVNDITVPSVTLTSPNGSENWLAGSLHNITWTQSDLSGDNLNYLLEYSSTGVAPWITVSSSSGTQGSKSFPWTVPSLATTTATCKVRVTVTDGYGNADTKTSTNPFTITVSTTPPTVAVILPNGGETLVGGTAYTITYTATDSVSGNFRYLMLQSIIGGVTENITLINNAPQAASGSGSFVWSVPNNASALCRVQIIALSQTGLTSTDQSDNFFEITGSTFAPTSANINLYRGWNLISLQLIPVNSNIGSVMAPVADKISSVWYYDTINGWQSWKPGAPSDLTISRDGKAYWVYVTDNSTLTYSGRVGPEPPDTMPTYTMAAGWNMVGFKSLADQLASDYLTPMTPSSIYEYDNALGTGYKKITIGTNLNPAKGYWVYFGTGGSFAP